MILDFWGGRIAVTCSDAAPLQQLLADFAPFAASETEGPAASVECRQLNQSVSHWDWLVPDDAFLAMHDPAQAVSQWQTGMQEFVLWQERYAVVRDRQQAAIQIWYSAGADPYPMLRSEVVQAARRLLNQNGQMLLHAGLAYDPSGLPTVLVPAAKGFGKTSACLLLTMAGFQLATDELTVLTSISPVKVSGIPRRLGLTEETLQRFFPHLLPLSANADTIASPIDGTVKRLIWPGANPQNRPPQMPLSAVLIPTIFASREAEIRPVSRDETRVALYEAALANALTPEETYRVAAQMADQVPGFRLLMGQDSEQNQNVLAKWKETLV